MKKINLKELKKPKISREINTAVRESGFSVAELARRLNKSRRHVYNIFENPQLSLDKVVQIGKIIHHDFSSDFSELKMDMQVPNTSHSTDADYWRNKYFELLEKYNSCWRSAFRRELEKGMEA